MGMKLNFHIGKLSIDGGSRADGLRTGEALRSHLTELARRGLPGRDASVDRIDAGVLPAGGSPERTGRHLADRIFRSLKGSSDA
jgi:hypothetical protein